MEKCYFTNNNFQLVRKLKWDKLKLNSSSDWSNVLLCKNQMHYGSFFLTDMGFMFFTCVFFSPKHLITLQWWATEHLLQTQSTINLKTQAYKNWFSPATQKALKEAYFHPGCFHRPEIYNYRLKWTVLIRFHYFIYALVPKSTPPLQYVQSMA